MSYQRDHAKVAFYKIDPKLKNNTRSLSYMIAGQYLSTMIYHSG